MMPTLRNPIVLVHGLFGFERIRIAGLTVASYFPAIPQLLREADNRALIPVLSPAGSVAERAQQLAAFLQRETREPVHVIAHSLGGLDARYAISKLGMDRHILTLTTLGTPHRGTAFADWGLARFERLLRPLLVSLGISHGAFHDLTRPACERFNEVIRDSRHVRYYSVAGRLTGGLADAGWLLPASIVSAAEGPNDGVVSLTSASYGEHTDVWEGDHLSLVNWFKPFGRNRGWFRDPAPRYARILDRLAAAGF